MRLLSARNKIKLDIDDYLDLLNLAACLGDQQWQNEIIRKLEMMQSELTDIANR